MANHSIVISDLLKQSTIRIFNVSAGMEKLTEMVDFPRGGHLRSDICAQFKEGMKESC